ncbi:fasciclin domain-containing protein [Jannaschia ovalis]|uniref:Fasciclin domain-containing protein n=1 Tax=Jannaschia ovalis TaxID=3038773 RepID=A0ABY8LB15_9RHOB|nr:fasciclin domain-containing protein [Jannaschia sp. GRR-S6-38]WGH77475.1 fasciclin domain-containing protein [Jannaschia sp. GRR-S6-38]
MIRRTFLALTAATALASPAFAAGHSMDIVATATEAGSFTTLLAAAEAAGLVETLQGEGPLTVFAPTDDAFAALPEGTVEELLMPENQERLQAILLYHVVPGAVMSGDLSDGMTAATANEMELEISIDGSTVMVEGATVTSADIEASNGVIHVIDSVMLPEM